MKNIVQKSKLSVNPEPLTRRVLKLKSFHNYLFKGGHHLLLQLLKPFPQSVSDGVLQCGCNF